MSRVNVDRDHYDVVWNRVLGGARSNDSLGIKAVMQAAMYEPADVAKYSGVSLTTVYALISEEGYAYSKRNGQPKASAEKVAAVFINASVDDLFKSKPIKQPKSESTQQSGLDCE